VCGAAILAHERDAFTRHMLNGVGPLPERFTACAEDSLEGAVR
jgi:hypothetical protein